MLGTFTPFQLQLWSGGWRVRSLSGGMVVFFEEPGRNGASLRGTSDPCDRHACHITFRGSWVCVVTAGIPLLSSLSWKWKFCYVEKSAEMAFLTWTSSTLKSPMKGILNQPTVSSPSKFWVHVKAGLLVGILIAPFIVCEIKSKTAPWHCWNVPCSLWSYRNHNWECGATGCLLKKSQTMLLQKFKKMFLFQMKQW